MSAAVWVVDTGDREIYTIADTGYEAAEHVAALIGGPIKYVEHYSDDLTDIEGQLQS